jgi:hypothetical protein
MSSPEHGATTMLRSFLMAVAMLATVATAANAAKDLPDCGNSEVQDTLQRVTRSITVIGRVEFPPAARCAIVIWADQPLAPSAWWS